MKLRYLERDSEAKFAKALECESVQRWLIRKLTSYSENENQICLEIWVDYWTKTEEPSFGWSIYEEDTVNTIITGGLIYNGDGSYSSHT